MPKTPTLKEAAKIGVSAALPLHVSAYQQSKDQGVVLRHLSDLWKGRGTQEGAKNANAALQRMVGRGLMPGPSMIKDGVAFVRGE